MRKSSESSTSGRPRLYCTIKHNIWGHLTSVKAMDMNSIPTRGNVLFLFTQCVLLYIKKIYNSLWVSISDFQLVVIIIITITKKKHHIKKVIKTHFKATLFSTGAPNSYFCFDTSFMDILSPCDIHCSFINKLITFLRSV